MAHVASCRAVHAVSSECNAMGGMPLPSCLRPKGLHTQTCPASQICSRKRPLSEVQSIGLAAHRAELLQVVEDLQGAAYLRLAQGCHALIQRCLHPQELSLIPVLRRIEKTTHSSLPTRCKLDDSRNANVSRNARAVEAWSHESVYVNLSALQSS